MTEVRKMTIAELRELIVDAGELKKGTEIADKGGLVHLSRHENKLFADASGSGASPYKVQIVFAEAKLTGRCSCMAARSRPFCKHAAALLVSWVRSPEAFAIAEGPPAAASGEAGAKKATVKRGKVDELALKRRGVEQAFTVLSELWLTGVATLAADRAGQVQDLATSLRELGLRRLSARMVDLSAMLALAARRDGSFDADAYAALLSDMWLTIRKLEKHFGGEALANEHVEELIGKTWTKKDRTPTSGHDLVEYTFLQRTTVDGFLLRESRFLDVASGEHFSEKQILPAQLAKRISPKPSYAGRQLNGASGTLFPSFAPRRIDLDDGVTEQRLTGEALERMAAQALPTVASALASFAERRRDPFAPPVVPVCLRAELFTPMQTRLRLLDPEGGSVLITGGSFVEDALAVALVDTRVHCVLGDIMLEGAIPALLPLAILGERDGSLRLVSLGGDDASALAESPPHDRVSWKDSARRMGVATAAVLLAEVRDDLASGFAEGASACATPRFIEPLASRLTDLSLGKQADALRAVVNVSDPVDALDALVKVHQVLGIALSRLAAAAPSRPDGLVRVPSLPSMGIVRPVTLLPPQAAVMKEAQREITRYERAYHVATYFGGLTDDVLLADVHNFWGDGFARSFVVRAVPSNEPLAVRNALALLTEQRVTRLFRRAGSRLAKLTAIAVLGAAKSAEARAALRTVRSHKMDPELYQHVRRALGESLLDEEEFASVCTAVIGGTTKDLREGALQRLADTASTEGIAVARAALRDRSTNVRRRAAFTLASLGDTDSLDVFISWLNGENPESARIGAYAIGFLGDVRGAGALLGALARGFSPAIIGESLQALGPWVLGPLLDLIEIQPELAKRSSVTSLVQTFPIDATIGTVGGWIEDVREDGPHVARRGKLALESVAKREDVTRALVALLEEDWKPVLDAKDADSRALRKKLDAIEKKRTAKTT